MTHNKQTVIPWCPTDASDRTDDGAELQATKA